MIPSEGFWHSSALSDQVIQCRQRRACRGLDKEREQRLRKCQRLSWDIINELDVLADLWKRAAHQPEVQRMLEDDMHFALSSSREQSDDRYCRLAP